MPKRTAERTKRASKAQKKKIAVRVKKYRRRVSEAGLRDRVALSDLMPLVTIEPSGCWRWTGPWKGHANDPYPVWRSYAGEQHARRAVLSAIRGRENLPRMLRTRTSCGRDDCVSPEHILLENGVIRRRERRARDDEGGCDGGRRVPDGERRSDGDGADERAEPGGSADAA